METTGKQPSSLVSLVQAGGWELPRERPFPWVIQTFLV
jgi:hypothetical protein